MLGSSPLKLSKLAHPHDLWMDNIDSHGGLGLLKIRVRFKN
jgi:hypothetical protein